jgi:hypothetical protein
MSVAFLDPPARHWNRYDLAAEGRIPRAVVRPEAAAGGRVMHWQDRNKGLVRIVVRLSAGMALGLVPAALYGRLVAAVHLAVYGRWDRAPAFALGCVIAGALLGLLGGVAWALSGNPAPVSRPAAKPSWPDNGFSVSSPAAPGRRRLDAHEGGGPARRPSVQKRKDEQGRFTHQVGGSHEAPLDRGPVAGLRAGGSADHRLWTTPTAGGAR